VRRFDRRSAAGASQEAWCRADAFGEQGVDLGVESISLSKAPDGACKVPDLTRIDHGERQIGASLAIQARQCCCNVSRSTVDWDTS
jgi:hypothetical protein